MSYKSGTFDKYSYICYLFLSLQDNMDFLYFTAFV